jgi:hypothetical protein
MESSLKWRNCPNCLQNKTTFGWIIDFFCRISAAYYRSREHPAATDDSWKDTMYWSCSVNIYMLGQLMANCFHSMQKCMYKASKPPGMSTKLLWLMGDLLSFSFSGAYTTCYSRTHTSIQSRMVYVCCTLTVAPIACWKSRRNKQMNAVNEWTAWDLVKKRSWALHGTETNSPTDRTVSCQGNRVNCRLACLLMTTVYEINLFKKIRPQTYEVRGLICTVACMHTDHTRCQVCEVLSDY